MTKQGKVAEETHPNYALPELTHLKVLQQNVNNICGFHALWNAKCMVRALLDGDAEVGASGSSKSGCGGQLFNKPEFWKHNLKIVDQVLRCNNNLYVTDTDKQEMKEDPECPLDRQHLKYLLLTDPEILTLTSTNEAFIQMSPFFAGFGLMNMDKEEVGQIQAKINSFQNTSDKDAIFVLFIGATSHWVTIVVHKKKHQSSLKFYLLDSSNLEYLNCEEDQIPALYDYECHNHVSLGIPRKTYDTFTTKMVLHSMIDLRRTI